MTNFHRLPRPESVFRGSHGASDPTAQQVIIHATHRTAVGHVVIIYRPKSKTVRDEYKEMVEDEVCFNSIIEQRMEFAASSLQMNLANM